MPRVPPGSPARTLHPAHTTLAACLDAGIGAISRSRWAYYQALDWFDPPAELTGAIEALIDAIEANVEAAEAIVGALDPKETA